MGHQLHPENGSGGVLGFVRRICELHAAALAATAGVNLRFDHHPSPELFRDLAGLFGRGGYLAGRHGDAVARQNALRLEFVNFHRVMAPPWRTGYWKCTERALAATRQKRHTPASVRSVPSRATGLKITARRDQPPFHSVVARLPITMVVSIPASSGLRSASVVSATVWPSRKADDTSPTGVAGGRQARKIACA